MNKRQILFLITLLSPSLHAQLEGMGPDTRPKDHPVPAIQDTETTAQRDTRMAWFREARFGMFIHWGLYSIPAGTWNGKQIPGIGEWIMNYASIPVADYKALAPRFKPHAFNAHDIVALAKTAGMKYIIITAKHHDGFAMFASKADPFNIVDATPFKRDPLRELAEECRRQGIKLGFYYSQNQDWTAPGGAAIVHGDHNKQTGHWDKAQDGDFDEYLRTKSIPQIKELLENYKEFPVVLWFDTPTKLMTPARSAEFVRLLNEHPNLIWNNRLGGTYEGDTDTPEQYIPARGFPGRDWEACMTMNETWGYKSDDVDFKSPEILLRNLIDLASKGGNYLLNIGPDSNGNVPAPEVERLREMGKWLAVNGAAIYGTKPTLFGDEAGSFSTTAVDKSGKPKFVPSWDWRSTTTADKVYLELFKWPNGTFHLGKMPRNVTRAYLLADPARKSLKFVQTTASLDVSLPAIALDPIANGPGARNEIAGVHKMHVRWIVLAFAVFMPVCAQGQTPSTAIVLQVDAGAAGTPLVHYWSKVVGAGRANEALRATWQDELRTVHDAAGFQYVRFHGIFHDDMFVYREDKEGHAIYNFQYVDDVFDRMLATGVKPFVELGFVPQELATTVNTDFWWKANGSPPNDYGKWSALVSHLVQHCLARYGAGEVRSWYFEVWNEPNLRYFFKNGTQVQYFELYKTTVQTIKAIDPQLRVGGPATSNFHIPEAAVQNGSAKQLAGAAIATGEGGDWEPIWVEDFLKYCAANRLPVDFVSTHPYPTDFPLDVAGEPQSRVRRSIDSTRNDLRTMRRIVDHSAYPHAEIQLTEWSSSPSALDHSHDSLAAAAFIVKTNLESIGLVDSLSYWVFTDVFEEERNTDSIFHGGFGLINYQQIVKPAFHAYRLLNELGDTRLGAVTGAFVTRDAGTHRLTALAYNYPPEMKVSLPKTSSVEDADKIVDTGSARALSLTLTGLRPGTAFLLETLDKAHGNAMAAWEQMNRPEPPTREQTSLLRSLAMATGKELVRADGKGRLTVSRQLEPWSVILVKQIE